MLSRIEEIIKDVYAVRHPLYVSNSYIVREENGLYLIDAGIYANGSDMISALTSIGASPNDVRGILLTHWHNDHTGGANAIRAISGATVYFHKDGEPYFCGKAPHPILRQLSSIIPEFGFLGIIKGIVGSSPPRPIHADIHVMQGQVIDDRFEVIETPGHEVGHVSYYFSRKRILFSGDALAVCRNRIWYMSRFLTQNISVAKVSMEKCLDIDFSIVCPGHRHFLRCSREDRNTAKSALLELKKWPIL